MAGQPDSRWDAIAIDAFMAATVPPHLITVEALGTSARVAPLTLVNVLDDRAARDVRAVAAALLAPIPACGRSGAGPGTRSWPARLRRSTSTGSAPGPRPTPLPRA